MDLYSIIDTLIAERNRIDRIIQSLDARGAAGADRRKAKTPARAARKRPGRKSMDLHARKDVSERMKRYWAQKRGDVVDSGNGTAEATPAVHSNGAGGHELETN